MLPHTYGPRLSDPFAADAGKDRRRPRTVPFQAVLEPGEQATSVVAAMETCEPEGKSSGKGTLLIPVAAYELLDSRYLSQDL